MALPERVRRTVNFDVSDTEPAEFFAVIRATYVPEWTTAPLLVRPSHETVAPPGCSVTAGVALLTIVPDCVSIREVTDAARANSNCATTRACLRGTESAGGTALPKPSVVLRANGRSNDDDWPRSSVALTAQRQSPSGSSAPSAVRPVQVKG